MGSSSSSSSMMKKKKSLYVNRGWSAFFLVFFFVLLIATVARAQSSNYDYVTTLIGTGGQGYGIGSVPPGAQVPHGMARVSPDTSSYDNLALQWMHFSGYWYNDSHIRAFSHTHLVGAGVRDLGEIGVMPVSFVPDKGPIWPDDGTFYSEFSHPEEIGKPGYYSVLLTTWNITAELTATPHTGSHRYTFHDTEGSSVVVFDMCHTLAPFGCKEASIEVNPATGELSGWVISVGSFSGQGLKTYFYAKSNNPIFKEFGTWDNYNVEPNRTQSSGTTAVGAYLYYGKTSEVNVVELYVGISFISVEQAQTNLQLEFEDVYADFDDVLNGAQTTWSTLLDGIQTTGATEAEYIMFYSSLYRSFMAPTNWSEAGLVYLGFDNQLHQVQNGSDAFYTDLSIWDVHRTQMPFLTFWAPDVLRDVVRSLLTMYVQLDYGGMPKWPFCNWDAGCMIGMHADIIVSDAYVKGLRDFDVDLAWRAMNQSLSQSQPIGGINNFQAWEEIGYIPYQGNTACSQTVEYAYDAGIVSFVAQDLGYTEQAAAFWKAGQNYRNMYNSDTTFFCPRYENGTWACPKTWINVFGQQYTEGDAWHWRFFAPHDIPGLVSLFPSTQYFIEELSQFFELGQLDPFDVLPNPYYWAGNEEDLLAVWLFDFVGRPDLTQKYSRWVLANRYTPFPDGLPGNDDYGAMSGWYIWTAIGFYPIAGTPTYAVGSPIFNSTVIQMKSGNSITIVANNFGPKNIYVQQVLVDGVQLSSPTIQHSQLVSAQTIEFFMSETPSAWNSAA